MPEFGYAGPPVGVHKGGQFKGQCDFSAICWPFSVLCSLQNSESAKANDLELAVFWLQVYPFRPFWDLTPFEIGVPVPAHRRNSPRAVPRAESAAASIRSRTASRTQCGRSSVAHRQAPNLQKCAVCTGAMCTTLSLCSPVLPVQWLAGQAAGPYHPPRVPSLQSTSAVDAQPVSGL